MRKMFSRVFLCHILSIFIDMPKWSNKPLVKAKQIAVLNSVFYQIRYYLVPWSYMNQRYKVTDKTETT